MLRHFFVYVCLTLAGGLGIHLLFGHSTVVIVRDVAHAVSLVLVVAATYLFFSGVKNLFGVHAPVWERNRQATLLAQKYNKQVPLSETESTELASYITAGILEHRGIVVNVVSNRIISPLRLTNQALEQIWK